jgi:NAD+ kinase
MIVGIRGTVRREGILQVLPKLCEDLDTRGISFLLSTDLLRRGGLSRFDCGSGGCAEPLPARELHLKADLIVTLGGDGSILAALRDTGEDTPILGVHMGTRGYLTAAVPSELSICLDRLQRNELLEEKRMMLRVETFGDDATFQADALNDVVVATAKPGRVIRLKTRINGEELFNVVGDGLIHATPTGSTAYNLGGGGPVLDPSMQAILLTPIMPHTISVRPIVASDEAVIETEVQSRHGRMLVSIDGQENLILPEGTRVRVTKSPRVATLLQQSENGFISVLRKKLKWNLED